MKSLHDKSFSPSPHSGNLHPAEIEELQKQQALSHIQESVLRWWCSPFYPGLTKCWLYVAQPLPNKGEWHFSDCEESRLCWTMCTILDKYGSFMVHRELVAEQFALARWHGGTTWTPNRRCTPERCLHHSPSKDFIFKRDHIYYHVLFLVANYNMTRSDRPSSFDL